MSGRTPNLVLLLLLFGTILGFSWYAPRFATASNFENLMSGFSFMAILTMGQTFPILVRGIDLSVGAIVGLVGMIIFDLSQIFGLPGYLVLAIALVASVLAGVLNGLLIVLFRLPPFIATLATLAAYRGLIFAISGRQLYPELASKPITDSTITAFETYFDIGQSIGLSSLLPIPWFPLSFFIMIGVFIALHLLLEMSVLGRNVMAVGGNAEAARLAGINVGLTTICAYALSGLTAGIAAILLVARLTTATETLGSGMELTAISAAVIGGVSLMGGVGNVIGPMLGAFFLGVVLIGLTLLGISQFVQQILTGIILLAAVGADVLASSYKRNRDQVKQGGEAA